MASFMLNDRELQLLASCITIGLEGASDNHVDVGGENTDADLEAIATLLEELDAIAATDRSAEITVMGEAG
jgi:hypothetical protein